MIKKKRSRPSRLEGKGDMRGRGRKAWEIFRSLRTRKEKEKHIGHDFAEGNNSD